MIWSSWADFIAMGGYGFYVWGSFGACALAVAAEVLALRARRRALQQHVARRGATPPFTGAPHEAQG